MADIICTFDGGERYEDVFSRYGNPQVLVINKNTTFLGYDEDGPVNSWDKALEHDEPVRFIDKTWVISVGDLLEYYLETKGLHVEEL